MLNEKELRIGNYCQDKNGVVYLGKNAFWQMLRDSDLEKLDPIAITDEWLLKFGFEKKVWRWNNGSLSNDDFWKNNLFVRFGFSTPILGRQNLSENTCSYIADINYVHQLQNLYFALTGEELSIQPLKKPKREL